MCLQPTCHPSPCSCWQSEHQNVRVLISPMLEVVPSVAALSNTLKVASSILQEALISGRLRSASVTLAEASCIGRLSAARFERWLLHAAIVPLVCVGARRRIRIVPDAGSPGSLRADSQHVGRIDALAATSITLSVPVSGLRHPDLPLQHDAAYCVTGGTRAERWLASFILASRGFDVRPLAELEHLS